MTEQDESKQRKRGEGEEKKRRCKRVTCGRRAQRSVKSERMMTGRATRGGKSERLIEVGAISRSKEEEERCRRRKVFPDAHAHARARSLPLEDPHAVSLLQILGFRTSAPLRKLCSAQPGAQCPNLPFTQPPRPVSYLFAPLLLWRLSAMPAMLGKAVPAAHLEVSGRARAHHFWNEGEQRR
ncbi:hypothetical protein CC85DRAFT_14930 [Cutaneotrichosporon oleaginosum]|uniref:Uncharacterized protein n=1 Tax=Cutaneotrichosporon oleaginosum TaxID=879819 RepID=A0A0J0XCF6_9TREE|nr:uncharacterized protein CC85DRAFT_14930 [Cutaneotrichosporon oleaginosum]KLT38763.1 hypothetical protein CC85DRAFT_14930 [Cutaneotrichosporon oleaginosum]TXT11489.1 hypothetical protein COLE_01899 [Cutaneotrichosporon oleaginosum]